MSEPWRHARWIAVVVGLAAGALVVAGCGTTPEASNPPSRVPVAAIGGPALDTSASSPGGTSWAVIRLGGSADALDNFWELFVRPPGAASWKLATPAGVASNGGLVMATTGATSLVTGFLPSQKLAFSPLALTADGGAQWSQQFLVSPGFGDVPFALGASATGQLLALTDADGVEVSADAGATWRSLAAPRALAGSAASRGCGVQALTAVAWTPTDSPLVAARCAQPGVAGIFVRSADGWRRTGPPLPASLSRDAIDVIGLATTGQRTTVILAARSATGTAVLAGWSADGGTAWRVSPTLTTGTSMPSLAIWADGSAGLVQQASTQPSATIGWQAAGWHTLPPLPARTAALAAGPAGQPQALAVSGSALTVWQLDTGWNHWTLTQTIRVPVPAGSSG